MALDFGGLTQGVRDLSPAQISTAQAQSAVNRAYQSILRGRPNGGVWFGLQRSATFSSVPDRVGGTCTLTQDSAIVAGVGTSWQASDAGRYLIIGDRVPLRILSVQGAGQLTLAQAWGEPTLAGSLYQIVTMRYALPADGDRVLRLVGPQWALGRRPLTMIDYYDPRRSMRRGVPLIYTEAELINSASILVSNPSVLSGSVLVAAGATSVVITHTAGTSSYQATAQASWAATCDILPGRTATTFTVGFTVPAPVGGQVDWIVVIPGASPGASVISTSVELELWPVPDQAITFTLQYRRRVADLVADRDVPVMAPEAILWMASAEQCRKLFSRTGDQTWQVQAVDYQAQADRVLGAMLSEDRRMQGVHPVALDTEDGIPFEDPAWLAAWRRWSTLGLSSVA